MKFKAVGHEQGTIDRISTEMRELQDALEQEVAARLEEDVEVAKYAYPLYCWRNKLSNTLAPQMARTLHSVK